MTSRFLAGTENKPDIVKKSLAFSMIVFMFMLLILPLASALPEINLNTTLNSSAIYTLPMLGSSVFEHRIETSNNIGPTDTQFDVDFIEGVGGPKWWNGSYPYRSAISFTPPAGIDSSYTMRLKINLATQLSEGKIRSDFANMRLVDDDVAINHKIVTYDSSSVTIEFRLGDYSSAKSMQLYYGAGTYGPISSEYSYRFIESFNGLDNWDHITGNYTLSSGTLYNSDENISIVRLANITSRDQLASSDHESPEFDLNYRFNLGSNVTNSSNSSLIFMLTNSDDLATSSSNVSIRFDVNTSTQFICQNEVCSSFSQQIDYGSWYDVSIKVSSSLINVSVGGISRITIAHSIPDMYLYFKMQNATKLDDMSIYKSDYDIIGSSLGSQQRLINKITGTAAGGEYNWNYDVTGFETGQYSILTEVRKNNYETNTSVDILNLYYNKIKLKIVENGRVTQIDDKYVADVYGSLTLTNTNLRNVSISIPYLTDLFVVDLSGGNFANSRIEFNPLEGGSSDTIDYYITGISYDPVLVNGLTALGSAIYKAGGIN